MQEHVQVDSSKCKACRRCEVACIASHHGLDFKSAMKQKALYSPRCWAVKGDDYKTSVRCHGCNPAPCCTICPTGALTQNKDGSFSFHMELCAGCMMCMSVCPYGCIVPEVVKTDETVPVLQGGEPRRPEAVRCDLCHDWRLEKGVEYTACMEACMAGALVLVKRDGTIIQAPKPEKKPAEKAPAESKPADEAQKKTPDAPVTVESIPVSQNEGNDTAKEENAKAVVEPKIMAETPVKEESKAVLQGKETNQAAFDKKKKGKKKK
ncbi:MAG: 4Fe-4S binding protein [Desulfovibrio sp.]|nr:4Fe-4S binding protein [Desulfovibrio sp.]